MNQNERVPDFLTALRLFVEGHQAGMWTALPGIVKSFNTDGVGKMTCTVQPAIQERWCDAQGNYSWVTWPLLVDVPVVFQGGGGYTCTFPIQEGDEALVIFSSRCIDGWWQLGGVRTQPELRMHDASDGFAIVGVRNGTRALENISTNSVQLRSDDGSTFIEVANGQIVNIIAPGGINLSTDGDITFDAGGNIVSTADGDITEEAGGDITETAGGNITESADAITETATTGDISMTSPTQVSVTSPLLGVSGAIAAGTGGGGGTVTIHGNITMVSGSLIISAGSVTASGDGSFGGKTMLTHKHHQANDSGGSTEADTSVAF